MKKTAVSLALLLISIGYNAQVGVNTELPLATLDVKEKRTIGVNDTSAKDGVMIPKLTKTELASKTATAYTAAQNGTIIYVSDASGGTTGTSVAQVTNINAIGFYYLDAAVWKKLDTDTDTNTNLYNIDGSLSGNRIVTQVGNTLAFTASAVNAFSVDGTTLSVDAANNRVGIGTAAPSQPLDVNANNNPLQISSLAVLPANTAITSLVIDGTGKVYKNSTQNVEGQILRYPISTINITSTEAPLRLGTGNTNAPNGAPNIINTIIGSQVNIGTSAALGNGAPARLTDQVSLPIGIYKIEVRLIGNFAAANASNTVFVKAIVGNNEYSFQPFGTNTGISGTTGFTFVDYINLISPSLVDFTVGAASANFGVVSSSTPGGGGSSYRSLILIQRLK